MKLHQDRPNSSTNQSPKRLVPSLFIKLLLGGALLFLLLFIMNNVVKNEVSTLIEQKNISPSHQSMESARNP